MDAAGWRPRKNDLDRYGLDANEENCTADFAADMLRVGPEILAEITGLIGYEAEAAFCKPSQR
jgi:hypothetical protein